MADSLQRKTVYALLWSFAEQAALKGVQFTVGIVLARLLFPEQFGLIGMLTFFIVVARCFLDGGFGDALIQKQDATQTDICSIFYFNILVGIAAAGLLCLVAPWIAAFYNQPILTPLTRGLSLTIVINSFGLIQDTILKKEINFKTKTKVTVIAGILSGLIGIAMAALGFGVWSLVAQQIAASLVSTVCLWFFSSWRPSLVFSYHSLRGMFGFGSRMLFSSVLTRVFDNIYFLVIGRLFTPADLGFFVRAKTLNDISSTTLPDMTGQVTFSVFSSIQDDPERVKRGMKKTITALVLVNFPIMIGLIAVARPLVLVLLTEKWLPSVPYLQLLSLVGLLYPLHMMNLNVLQSLGRSDLFLRLEIIKKIMIVVNIAITWRWGISAMIWGMVVTSLIGYYLNCYYTGDLIRYPLGEQARDQLPYFIASALMGLAVHAVGLLQFPRQWAMLVVQIVTGVIVYVALCRALRLKAFMDMWQAMWSKMPALRTGATR